ncbi:MAG: ArsR/SmtB family transcription factor [Christensenellales bacterium]
MSFLNENCDLNNCNVVLPSENEIYNLAEFFKVIGDSTRIKILSALEYKDLAVCDLCGILDMSMSAISHQLRILKQSDLVRYRRQGKNIIYSLADEHIKLIVNMALEHINEK